MAVPPSGVDYKRYLASREWSLLREQVRERSANTCEHCFYAPQEAVHHLTYERIGHEKLSDLMAVCNACHEFLSGISQFNPMGDWAVVTPPFHAESWSEEYKPGNHYLLPFEPRRGTRVTKCTGAGCIWCTYIDGDWPIFLIRLVKT